MNCESPNRAYVMEEEKPAEVYMAEKAVGDEAVIPMTFISCIT